MTSGRKKYKIIKFEGVSYRYSFIFYLKSIEKLTVRNFIYLFDSIRILKKTNLFNSEYYLMNNPELEKVGINPYFHYLYYGGFKGANPSEYFDSALYLAKYSDVKFKTVNPLVHYIRYGHIESRLPHIEYRNRINNLANYKKEKQESYIKTRNRIKCLKIRPLFTVIIFFEENIRTLIENISSINNQSYNNWTMHILHESTLAPSSILKLVKPKLKRVIGFEKGSSFAIALKNVLESSVGDYVVLIRGKDLVAKNALLEYCEIINSNISDLIYSDEDYINENGIFINPNYKPDYSYDMLLSQNYFGYSSVISRKLMNQIELCECRSVESLYYDLYLQIAEKSETITHIPKILCHNRVLASSEKSVSNAKKVQEECKKMLRNHLSKVNIEADVVDGHNIGTFIYHAKISGNPLVSIIIPFKDKAAILTLCLKSLIEKTTYRNIEIICVSNNSEEIKTFKEINKLKKLDSRIKFYEYNIPFNYSNINNFAVKNYSKGEYIVLLNNDVEIITDVWVENMLGLAQRDDVGAVGAKLYYPNDSIQSAGIVIGMFDVVGEPHKYFDRSDPGYFGRLMINQNISAITAAFLMVSKQKYESVGGLDEKHFIISYNDVDFCLRLIKQGLNNVFTPHAEAYHYEALSRGKDQKEQYISESRYLKEFYKDILINGDKYYNPNLPKNRQDFNL